MIKEIHEPKDFDLIMENEKTFILYKHSSRCNVSFDAYNELNEFIQNSKKDIYLVKVIESRALSNYIEERTGIRHESPQVLFFENAVVKSHGSHFQITKSFMDKYAV